MHSWGLFWQDSMSFYFLWVCMYYDFLLLCLRSIPGDVAFLGGKE